MNNDQRSRINRQICSECDDVQSSLVQKSAQTTEEGFFLIILQKYI